MNVMRIMLLSLLLLACGCSGENTIEGARGSGDGTGLKVIAPLNGIYLGAYDWRENSSKPGVKEFEDALGVKVALTSGGVCISRESEPFSIDAACLKRLNQKGYVVLIDVVSRKHSPQQIIDGQADQLLVDVADAIKSANVPMMLAYPREPELQPQIGFDGGGYGPNGEKVRELVDDAYGAYGCTNKDDQMCLDGPERYRDMCKHIHDVIESMAPGIATWVAGAAVLFWPGQKTRDHYKLFCPGDACVDWHAIDVYPAVAGESDDPRPTKKWAEVVDTMWAEIAATSPDKPVVLTEFGVHPQTGGRDAWFRDFFTEVRTNAKYGRLKAFIYWQMGTDAFDGSNCRIRATDSEAVTWRTEIVANKSFWHSDVKTADRSTVTGSGGGL
ncbi:MAG: hypothetical protein JW720_05975 [Sedimentisphaerales bacterium]|nr:hypothetical protein [Sedimentisphaerales bacterium]